MQVTIIRHTLRAMRTQWWPAKKISAWQEQALVRSMRHACATVPFYRALGIAPESLSCAQDLQRFPVLTKKDLQINPTRFLAQDVNPAALYSSRTSGSTGEPTLTYFDRDAWALCKYALKIRRTLAVTTPVFHRCLIVNEQAPSEAQLYSRQRPFKREWLYAERVVSLFGDLALHRETIRQFRPDMLYAFPSYLLELLRAYEEAGEPPPRIPLLFTSSEVLTTTARVRIQSGFRGRLFDIYGSTEFKEVAWQCAAGAYHLNFESVHVETSSENAASGLLLSTLCNHAMPLLRFDTGDLGALEYTKCSCGRESPQLRISCGREGDMVQLPSGRRLSPYALTSIIEKLPGLHQYRLMHEQPARLSVELVTAEDLSRETLEACRMRLLAALRESMEVSLRRVTSLERGAGGKHKVFVRSW